MKEIMESNKGFTLLEVLIVMAIIAIGSAVAAPMMNDFVARYRLRGAARDITSTLQLMRLEAVKRKVNCVMTFSQPVNGDTFDYVAFVDSNEDWVYDPGETVLARINFDNPISIDTAAGGVTFINNAASKRAIAFNSRGFPRESGGVLLAADREVNLKNDIGGKKQIEMVPSGRVKIN
jgi:type IV fimbrial biogenesis protein FimT